MSLDLFKMKLEGDMLTFDEGEFIKGATSKSWIERYRDAGEFEIVAPLSSGLRDFIPEGTLISHINTSEVMIVENHALNEDAEEDPIITITGRTLETWLDNRIVGTEEARTTPEIDEYELASNDTHVQIIVLCHAHMVDTGTDDDMGNVRVESEIVGAYGVSEARAIKPGPLYQAVFDLLAVDDLGIKVVRRSAYFPDLAPDPIPPYTALRIHKGVDRSKTVIFSWKSGDLEAAEYLFSSKKYKNAALVVGRYIWRVVSPSAHTNYNRRFMMVEASDIDGHLTSTPTGATLVNIQNKMTTRGRQELKKQKRITLSRTDISANSKYRYRRDYDVGDLVMIEGNFGQLAKMRVIEYVEIEDETGQSEHPTLSLPDGPADSEPS